MKFIRHRIYIHSTRCWSNAQSTEISRKTNTNYNFVHSNFYCRWRFPRQNKNSSLFPHNILIIDKPVNGCGNGIIERCEMEIGSKCAKFSIRCRLLVLAIRFRCIEFNASLEIEGFSNCTCNRFNWHLVTFVNCKWKWNEMAAIDVMRTQDDTWQDDWFHTVIVSQHPNGQTGQIVRINELSQWFAGAVNGENSLVLWRGIDVIEYQFMHSLNHAGYHMTMRRMEIVVRAENIARNNRCEHSLVFVEVRPIRNVYQSFGITVAVIGIMGRPVVDLQERGEVRRNLFEIRMEYDFDLPWSHQWDTKFCPGKCTSTNKTQLCSHSSRDYIAAHCRSFGHSSATRDGNWNKSFVCMEIKAGCGMWTTHALPKNPNYCSYYETDRRPLPPNG